MIDAWRLGHFKKFGHKKEFPLKPLTILSGVNSSGKSSLLQSILLVKQTLMGASPDRAIALNGPLVQLGAYSDIHNANTPEGDGGGDGVSEAVSFGWTLSEGAFSDNIASYGYLILEAERCEVKVDFKVSNASRKKSHLSSEMYPTLLETSVRIILADEDGSKYEQHLSLSKSKGGGRPLQVDTSDLEGAFDPQEYLVSDVDDETRKEILGSFPSARLSGGSLQNFLPNGVAIRYDRAKFEQAEIRSAILQEHSPTRRRPRLSIQIPSRIIDFIQEHARKVFETAEKSPAARRAAEAFEQLASGSSLLELHRAIQSIHPSTRKRLIIAFKENKDLLDGILKEITTSDLTLTKRTPEIFDLISSINSQFFRFHVHYVGPLRDEPRPIYSSRQISSSTDVGPRGEFTAAVLSLNEQTTVNYLFPDLVREDRLTFVTRKASLPKALSEWIEYLGVASSVLVSERGSLGYELKVKTQTDQYHRDLTNVGVGVSQILPVVISVLLAAPGATVLLEQPELHLHPRVQSRLCDFFLAASKQNKQLIIETHSEHIIERLRLRIAQDESSEIMSNSSIYFFDNSPEAASSISISEYGAVMDWPHGFFDESSDQTSRILEASMKKRVARKKSRRRD